MSAQDASSSIYTKISIGVTCLGMAIVGYLTLTQWLAPTTPMLLAGSAIAILLLCLNGLVVFYYHSDRNEDRSMLRAALVWTLVSAGGGVAFGSAWMSARVRARVLQQLPESQVASAKVTSTMAAKGDRWRQIELAALDDPDRSVAARACRRIVETGPGLQRAQLLEHLERRPQLARTCIESSRKADSAEVASRAVKLSRVLQTRWIDAATSQASARPREACRRLDPVLTLPDRASIGTPALLRCAVGDEPDAFQQCCTSQLIDHVGEGRAIGAELDASINETIARELASPLLRASVYRTQLNKKEKARFDKLKLQHPDTQRFALRLSCNFIMQGGHKDLVRQMSAWLERDQCLGRSGALNNDYTEWAELCGRALEPLAQADYPGQRLCALAEGHLVDLTVERARERMQAAIGGGLRSMWEEGIQSGTRMEDLENSSPEALKRSMGELFGPGGSTQDKIRSFIRAQRGLDSSEALGRLTQQQARRLDEAREEMSEARKGSMDLSDKFEGDKIDPEDVSQENDNTVRKRMKKLEEMKGNR